MRAALVLLGLLLSLEAHAANVYLCEAFSGGTFWSSAPCTTHKASTKRIVGVPDGMPFEQQVELGRQAESAARQLTAGPSHVVATPSAAPAADECAMLNEHIRVLDAQARQPQTGASQDRITAQRRQARDRQFWLRCR